MSCDKFDARLSGAGFLKPAAGPASATQTPCVTPQLGLSRRSLQPTLRQAPLQLNRAPPVVLMRSPLSSLEGAAQKGNVRVGLGVGRGVKRDRLSVRFENSFEAPSRVAPTCESLLLNNDSLITADDSAELGRGPAPLQHCKGSGGSGGGGGTVSLPLLEALLKCESALRDTCQTERFFIGAQDILVLTGDGELHPTQKHTATSCVHCQPSLQTDSCLTYVGRSEVQARILLHLDSPAFFRTITYSTTPV